MCKVVLWYEADTEWLTIEVDSDEDGDMSYFDSPLKKNFRKIDNFLSWLYHLKQLAQIIWKL